jgi:hypothetical protein
MILFNYKKILPKIIIIFESIPEIKILAKAIKYNIIF